MAKSRKGTPKPLREVRVVGPIPLAWYLDAGYTGEMLWSAASGHGKPEVVLTIIADRNVVVTGIRGRNWTGTLPSSAGWPEGLKPKVRRLFKLLPRLEKELQKNLETDFMANLGKVTLPSRKKK